MNDDEAQTLPADENPVQHQRRALELLTVENKSRNGMYSWLISATDIRKCMNVNMKELTLVDLSNRC